MTFGFWMNRRGTLHRIIEHGRAIIDQPRRYGLTRADVEAIVGTDGLLYDPNKREQDSPRGRLYLRVMNQGWIRLREGRDSWSIQFVGDESQVLRLLLRKVAPEYWGVATVLEISDLSGDHRRHLVAGQLKDLLAQD